MAGPPSFYENLRQGVSAPQVDPDDLRRVWEFLKTVRARLPAGQSSTGAAPASSNFGIDSRLLAEHCSPGADVAAVMFRCQFMQLLVQQGALARWVHGETPDPFLFQVFAVYPVHVGEFDTASLLQHLSEKCPEAQ